MSASSKGAIGWVIPRSRALLRAVGTAAGALFNYFVFPYAQTHGKEIFAGFGILYFVSAAGRQEAASEVS